MRQTQEVPCLRGELFNHYLLAATGASSKHAHVCVLVLLRPNWYLVVTCALCLPFSSPSLLLSVKGHPSPSPSNLRRSAHTNSLNAHTNCITNLTCRTSHLHLITRSSPVDGVDGVALTAEASLNCTPPPVSSTHSSVKPVFSTRLALLTQRQEAGGYGCCHQWHLMGGAASAAHPDPGRVSPLPHVFQGQNSRAFFRVVKLAGDFLLAIPATPWLFVCTRTGLNRKRPLRTSKPQDRTAAAHLKPSRRARCACGMHNQYTCLAR